MQKCNNQFDPFNLESNWSKPWWVFVFIALSATSQLHKLFACDPFMFTLHYGSYVSTCLVHWILGQYFAIAGNSSFFLIDKPITTPCVLDAHAVNSPNSAAKILYNFVNPYFPKNYKKWSRSYLHILRWKIYSVLSLISLAISCTQHVHYFYQKCDSKLTNQRALMQIDALF